MRFSQLVMTFLACCLATDGGGLAEASAEQKPMRVAALGTSLTHSGGWLTPLERHLARCLQRSINLLDFGRDGATSEWGVAILDEVILAQPDIVLIEFAVNDAALFKGMSLKQSRGNVRNIVRTLRAAQPHVKIFLMTMNPSSGLRGSIRPRLNAYYDDYKLLADELGTGYIDNFSAWNTLTKQELRERIPDGLHPIPESACRILVPAIAGAIGGTECVATTMNE